MAELTTATLDEVTVDALILAGYPNAVAGDAYQLLAEDWFKDFLVDIWHTSKQAKFKTLLTERLIGLSATSGVTNSEGVAIYANPNLFAHPFSMSLLEGTHFGTCQVGADASSPKLASGEDLGLVEARGKELVVFTTATPTDAESSFIRHLASEVATVSPALPTKTSAVTDSYVAVEKETPIECKGLWTANADIFNYTRGTPTHYFLLNDYGGGISTAGGMFTVSPGGMIMFRPIPHWGTDGKIRAFRQRYYANLARLDPADGDSGEIMNEILINWRAELVQYIIYKAHYKDKDERWESAFKLWEKMKAELIASETYGQDLSNIQAVVNA